MPHATTSAQQEEEEVEISSFGRVYWVKLVVDIVCLMDKRTYVLEIVGAPSFCCQSDSGDPLSQFPRFEGEQGSWMGHHYL